MKITAISNKKETLQKLFPLESFKSFKTLPPLSWSEVLKSKSKYIQNPKFNLNGTVKPEWETSLTEEEERNYWLARLAYFKDEPSIVDDDFNTLCLIDIKKNIDDDWLLNSGIESLVYAIYNGEKVFVVGESKDLTSVFSTKQIKETFDINPKYLWELQSLDLNSVSMINSNTGYNTDWLKEINSVAIDEIKYFLKQDEDFKKIYRMEIISNNNIFRLLEDASNNIVVENNKALIIDFISDVAKGLINETEETKNKYSYALTSFILKNVFLPLTLNISQNQIEKIIPVKDIGVEVDGEGDAFILDGNENNNITYQSIKEIKDKNTVVPFKININHVNEETALELWNFITSEENKSELCSIIQSLLQKMNSNGLLAEKFSWDSWSSKNEDIDKVNMLSNFMHTIQQHFPNLLDKEVEINKVTYKGLGDLIQQVQAFLEVENLIETNKEFNLSSSKFVKDAFRTLSRVDNLNKISRESVDIRIRKMVMPKVTANWLNFAFNMSDFLQELDMSDSGLHIKNFNHNNPERAKITLQQYLVFSNNILDIAIADKSLLSELNEIYEVGSFELFSSLKNKQLTVQSPIIWNEKVFVDLESVDINTVNETILKLRKFNNNNVNKIDSDRILENIIKAKSVIETPAQFAQSINKFLEEFNEPKMLSVIYEEVKKYKNFEIFFKQMGVELDEELFKILHKAQGDRYNVFLDKTIEATDRFFKNDQKECFLNINGIAKFITSTHRKFTHNQEIFEEVLFKNLKHLNLELVEEEKKEELFTLLIKLNNISVFQFLLKNYENKAEDILLALNNKSSISINPAFAKKIIQIPEFLNNKRNLKELSRIVVKELTYDDFKGISLSVFENNLDLFLNTQKFRLNNNFDFERRLENPLYAIKVIKIMPKIFLNNNLDSINMQLIKEVLNNILNTHKENKDVLINYGLMLSDKNIDTEATDIMNNILLENMPIHIRDMLRSTTLEKVLRENELINNLDIENTPVIKRKKI